jgi:hypothetical protein
MAVETSVFPQEVEAAPRLPAGPEIYQFAARVANNSYFKIAAGISFAVLLGTLDHIHEAAAQGQGFCNNIDCSVDGNLFEIREFADKVFNPEQLKALLPKNCEQNAFDELAKLGQQEVSLPIDPVSQNVELCNNLEVEISQGNLATLLDQSVSAAQMTAEIADTADTNIEKVATFLIGFGIPCLTLLLSLPFLGAWSKWMERQPAEFASLNSRVRKMAQCIKERRNPLEDGEVDNPEKYIEM